MRLATILTGKGPSACALQGAHYVELHATDPALPCSVRALLAAGPEALRAAAQAARRPDAVKHDAAGVKLLAPVPDPQKIVCLGLNYRDHAAEAGQEIPAAPMWFAKFGNSLIGSGEPV